jgi:hypothetical protein
MWNGASLQQEKEYRNKNARPKNLLQRASLALRKRD